MFKRELKVNLKNFIIWTSILIFLFLIVFLIYPSIMNSSNHEMIDEMIKIFPPEVLKALNMDLASIDSAFGWLKTEGFVILLLITGTYSAILGSNICLKEENDKTIEYLNSLPITRTKIITSKILCALFYIISQILLVNIFNFIALLLSGDFEIYSYILLSITPIFSSVTLFSLCLLISTFSHKSKNIFGLSIGIVFISYFIQIISQLSSKTEFFKYFSIFSLADVRNVIIETMINPIVVIISLVVSIALLTLSISRYNSKELL